MEDTQIVLERHEQRIKMLERDISDLKALQVEIRTMNETLVTLATELKHTNEHLERHEQKIDAIEGQPRIRMQQIITAIIAALSGGLISVGVSVYINQLYVQSKKKEYFKKRKDFIKLHLHKRSLLNLSIVFLWLFQYSVSQFTIIDHSVISSGNDSCICCFIFWI